MEDLLLWKDVKRSGLVFGGASVFSLWPPDLHEAPMWWAIDASNEDESGPVVG